MYKLATGLVVTAMAVHGVRRQQQVVDGAGNTGSGNDQVANDRRGGTSGGSTAGGSENGDLTKLAGKYAKAKIKITYSITTAGSGSGAGSTETLTLAQDGNGKSSFATSGSTFYTDGDDSRSCAQDTGTTAQCTQLAWHRPRLRGPRRHLQCGLRGDLEAAHVARERTTSRRRRSPGATPPASSTRRPRSSASSAASFKGLEHERGGLRPQRHRNHLHRQADRLLVEAHRHRRRGLPTRRWRPPRLAIRVRQRLHPAGDTGDDPEHLGPHSHVDALTGPNATIFRRPGLGARLPCAGRRASRSVVPTVRAFLPGGSSCSGSPPPRRRRGRDGAGPRGVQQRRRRLGDGHDGCRHNGAVRIEHRGDDDCRSPTGSISRTCRGEDQRPPTSRSRTPSALGPSATLAQDGRGKSVVLVAAAICSSPTGRPWSRATARRPRPSAATSGRRASNDALTQMISVVRGAVDR